MLSEGYLSLRREKGLLEGELTELEETAKAAKKGIWGSDGKVSPV